MKPQGSGINLVSLSGVVGAGAQEIKLGLISQGWVGLKLGRGRGRLILCQDSHAISGEDWQRDGTGRGEGRLASRAQNRDGREGGRGGGT